MRASLVVLALMLGTAEAGEPPLRKGLVHIPRGYARMMELHLREIEVKDWAEVTPGDLYHGHVILPVQAAKLKRFKSLDELFSHSLGILYHSDEMLVRWRLTDGDLPVRQRRPRSIMGYWREGVIDAASLMADPVTDARNYEWYGSITTDDLAREEPTRLDMRRDREVRMRGGNCLVNLQVDIGLGHGAEPVITVGEDRLKTTMDCMAQPSVPSR